jgi:hypothetical protein
MKNAGLILTKAPRENISGVRSNRPNPFFELDTEGVVFPPLGETTNDMAGHLLKTRRDHPDIGTQRIRGAEPFVTPTGQNS